MESSSAPSLWQPALSRKKKKLKTEIYALNQDLLCMIFAFLDLVQLIRCSAVCKSWCTAINKLELLQTLCGKQDANNSLPNSSLSSGRLLSKQLEQLAMEGHRFSLHKGPVNLFQWKGHSMQVNKCRMKKGLVLTGAGDKVMRLWSAESYNLLDEYAVPDKAPLIDFDFDEGKVVGLVGTHISIWTRTRTRNIFSSRDGMFTRGLCMRYVDPEAVVGCEDGKVRIFDMYSRKFSRIIKMHSGPVTCLSFNDDQLLVSGSTSGSISISDLSSDQHVTTLRSTSYSSAGIKTLCMNPCSHLLFAGSTSGNASCWDLRVMKKPLWEKRLSPNVVYSIDHMKNDKSTIVVGGIDGVLRIVDQETGDILSMCIMEQHQAVSSSSISIPSKEMTVRRLHEDVRIDLMPVAARPPITCLSVGMQKVVTLHNDKLIRVWKFKN